MPRSILVVDDDPAIRELVREFLADLPEPLEFTEAATLEEARTRFDESAPELVLLDMNLPDGDGLDLLPALRAESADLPVVVITADSSSSRTIRAIQAGAYDYLVKPLEPETVQHVIARALETRRPSDEIDSLQQEQGGGVDEHIVGTSPAMQEVYKLVGRVAASDVPVLITGETGTGKELVAEILHQSSRRRRGPLVRVNCAALPETLLESELFGHERGAFTGAVERRKGRFELADGGSIFLDEIGELEPSTQKKLLRVLQFGSFERVGGQASVEVDVRVIAATNVNLEAAMAAGRFREDLFYRLNVIRIELPPLRERRSDVPALVAHFLDRYRVRAGAAPTKISQEAMDRLLAESWPGNVRQLENAIQRAVVLSAGRPISPEHLDLEAHERPAEARDSLRLDLDAALRASEPLDDVLGRVEAAMVAEALRRCEGDPARAAARLGVARERVEAATAERAGR